VQGRVVDEDGNPVPNVMVISPEKIISSSGVTVPKQETVTDTDGFFRLKPDWGWHGACFLTVEGVFSKFPSFSGYPLSYAYHLLLVTDKFPTQMVTLNYWRDKTDRVEGFYIYSKDIILYQQTTANYLATVVPEHQAQDILVILLCEVTTGTPAWEKGLKPVHAITDTNLIQTIISEMSVPAEMATGFRHDAANTLSCMVFLFRDTSLDVGVGHFITHDGTVMNCHVRCWDNLSYLLNVTPDTSDAHLPRRWKEYQKRRSYIEQRNADVTWRFQSKTIADLVRNILSSEHPDFIVKP